MTDLAHDANVLGALALVVADRTSDAMAAAGQSATAAAALSVADDRIEARATWDALIYYAADGTSSYVGLMYVDGRLGDRTGSFVMEGTGAYDGAEARGESTVVTATASGELRGLRGTGLSVSTHDDYPFMPLVLDYEVE